MIVEKCLVKFNNTKVKFLSVDIYDEFSCRTFFYRLPDTDTREFKHWWGVTKYADWFARLPMQQWVEVVA